MLLKAENLGETWQGWHIRSEAKALEAEVAKRTAAPDLLVRELYAEAAEFEQLALACVDVERQNRTASITAVSAVSLLYKAGKFRDAARLARLWLQDRRLTLWSTAQLEQLATLLDDELSNLLE